MNLVIFDLIGVNRAYILSCGHTIKGNWSFNYANLKNNNYGFTDCRFCWTKLNSQIKFRYGYERESEYRMLYFFIYIYILEITFSYPDP